MKKTSYIYSAVVLAVCFTTVSTTRLSARTRPLYEEPLKKILEQYHFVNDFRVHPPERDNSEFIFWRYPLRLPKPFFPVEYKILDVDKELPATEGSGKALHHVNRGRRLFLEKKYRAATKVWLAGRSRFGREYDFYRRNDYLIGIGLMNRGMADQKGDYASYHKDSVRTDLLNATTFLSGAFIQNTKDPDPVLDAVAPKQYYNLAAIFYHYERYSGSFGAAKRGIDYLRREGRREYRSELSRLMAEAHIQNRSYLEAVRMLDTTLRMSPKPDVAAAIFARVADVYFDLNNYDLAEENYALANRIDFDMKRINPAQFVLRGEALFWLGRFDESLKVLDHALAEVFQDNAYRRMSKNFIAYASLRKADAYLALKRMDEARLEYFKVLTEFRGTEVGRIAQVRSACLDLPFFDGKNVGHARARLQKLKTAIIPEQARELVWACHVGSYASRERTTSMVDRVREFFAEYPKSRFLKSLTEPVKEVQARKLDSFLNKGDLHSATSFFEKTRDLLFEKLSESRRKKLFAAYVDLNLSHKAVEFWRAGSSKTNLDLLREATFLAEMSHAKGASSNWHSLDKNKAKELTTRSWSGSIEGKPMLLVERINSIPGATHHLPWVYDFVKAWAGKDYKKVCDYYYHQLVRYFRSAKETRLQAQLRDDLEDMVSEQLPTLFTNDESCAVSVLDFELLAFKDNPKTLANIYLERKEWPMNEELAGMYWDVAEISYHSGHVQHARKLWKSIVDRAPNGSSKARFARNRLEKRKTEFEMLWQ